MFKYVRLTSARDKHFRLVVTKQGIYSSQNVTEICLRGWGGNHQTVTLMLHVKCISAVGSESVICAGSHYGSLLARPRQSSTCEIHGSCMFKLNAQPAFQQGLPNIPLILSPLASALRCPTLPEGQSGRTATREKSFGRCCARLTSKKCGCNIYGLLVVSR